VNTETTHKIIIGDSRKLDEVADESVHLVITSPPYWQLKDYGADAQVGFNQTYEQYINNLNLVWSECHRVLHKGCRLCINIGDQFARKAFYGRYKVIPIRTEIIKFCETAGFDYMGAVIWKKVTTCNTTGGGAVMGSFPFPRNGILKLDYEFILIFKKLGQVPNPDTESKEASRLTTEEWNIYFSGHWNFPGIKQDKHLAMFPIELPNRLIKMFSFVGDTVLDPFAGSATTNLAAMNLNRNSVGFEINSEFLPVIKDKLNTESPSLFPSGADVKILIRDACDTDFSERIKHLPYIFNDLSAMDKQVDPKKGKYNSRISDDQDPKREDYFRIKKIISSEKVILSNNHKIRLLGVKVNPENEERAVKFLKEETKGKKVYIRRDPKWTKQDNKGYICCYLHLQNKSFVNYRLVKKGYAYPDDSRDYKLKKKFLKCID